MLITKILSFLAVSYQTRSRNGFDAFRKRRLKSLGQKGLKKATTEKIVVAFYIVEPILIKYSYPDHLILIYFQKAF